MQQTQNQLNYGGEWINNMGGYCGAIWGESMQTLAWTLPENLLTRVELTCHIQAEKTPGCFNAILMTSNHRWLTLAS